MEADLPGAADIREAMARLTNGQLEALAEASGVPFATLYKIKRGETLNPGIETVRKFMPHLRRLPDAAVAALQPAQEGG